MTLARAQHSPHTLLMADTTGISTPQDGHRFGVSSAAGVATSTSTGAGSVGGAEGAATSLSGRSNDWILVSFAMVGRVTQPVTIGKPKA